MLLKCWSNSWMTRKENPCYFPLQPLRDGFPRRSDCSGWCEMNTCSHMVKKHSLNYFIIHEFIRSGKEKVLQESRGVLRGNGRLTEGIFVGHSSTATPPRIIMTAFSVGSVSTDCFSICCQEGHTHTLTMWNAKTNKLNSCGIGSSVCSSL